MLGESLITCCSSSVVQWCMLSISTRFLLWRNYSIKNVVLFEEDSILPLPECPEAPWWQLLISIEDRSDSNLRFVDRDQELPSGRLRTPRERNGRVRLDEDCTFDAAIPRKDGFRRNPELLSTTCTWKAIPTSTYCLLLHY